MNMKYFKLSGIMLMFLLLSPIEAAPVADGGTTDPSGEKTIPKTQISTDPDIKVVNDTNKDESQQAEEPSVTETGDQTIDGLPKSAEIKPDDKGKTDSTTDDNPVPNNSPETPTTTIKTKNITIKTDEQGKGAEDKNTDVVQSVDKELQSKIDSESENKEVIPNDKQDSKPSDGDKVIEVKTETSTTTISAKTTSTEQTQPDDDKNSGEKNSEVENPDASSQEGDTQETNNEENKQSNVDETPPNKIADTTTTTTTTSTTVNEEEVEHAKENNSDVKNPDSNEADSNDDKRPISVKTPSDGHFFYYFVFFVLLILATYLLYHNRRKVGGYLLKSGNKRRTGTRKTSGNVKYEKLGPSEEATSSLKNYVF